MDLINENLIIICRETNVSTGQTVVYKINKYFENKDLLLLSIRSRLNHELRYFVKTESIYNEKKKEIQKSLKLKSYKQKLKDMQYIYEIDN